MITIENIDVCGFEAAIRGMRNPMNSWDKSDSGVCKGGDNGIGCDRCSEQDSCKHAFDGQFKVGINDLRLMKNLATAGTSHSKYRRMITVTMDVVAPLYWWKEFDQYKVGTVTDSCSTMHKIHEKEFTIDDFSHDYLGIDDSYVCPLECLRVLVDALNSARYLYLKSDKKEKKYWYYMIQLLPSSYNQRRTVLLNYEVLANIYKDRRAHKLQEWRTFCEWIDELPCSEIITE